MVENSDLRICKKKKISSANTYPANVSKFLEQIYIGRPGIIMFISKTCDEKRLFHLENELTTSNQR